MKRIITHAALDGDAIAATWLVEKFIFTEETVKVSFVARSFQVSSSSTWEAIVDVGRVHDPARLIFDHKPPAFRDRNLTCATRLVWDHLRANGKSVDHLTDLVLAVHEGDRFPRTKSLGYLSESLKNGFHARLTQGRKRCQGDGSLYLAMRAWLNRHEARLREAHGLGTPPLRELEGTCP